MMRLNEIIKEIELKGVLFIVLVLCYIGIVLLFYEADIEIIPFKLFLFSTLIAFPMSCGYLFRDPEREKVDDIRKLGIAWCKGMFLIMFFLGPIIMLMIGLIWLLTR